MKWYILCYVWAACQLIGAINSMSTGDGKVWIYIGDAAIFFALGYFLMKRYNKKQEEAQRIEQEKQNAIRASEEARAKRQIYECKVAGVTYKNADGSDRQRILKRIYDSRGGSMNEIMDLEPYKYEGDDAIKVVSVFGEVGNIPARCVDDVMDIIKYSGNLNPILIVNEFEDDEGDIKYAGKLSIYHDPIQK